MCSYQNLDLRFQARRFKRWLWVNQSFLEPDGRLNLPDEKRLPLSRHQRSDRSAIEANWRATGPLAELMDPWQQESRIGRMCQIKFHPHQPRTIYAISGSGGLFISDDHGDTWRSTGTDALPFGYQPASICIDHSNDQTLYLGMGDPNFGSQGHGVWKSNDGGESWTSISHQIGDKLVYEVLMSPLDHQDLVVAAEGGIWISNNAGDSWQQTLSLVNDDVLDMKFKPGAKDTLYGCTFSRFYRSTDGGISWKHITEGIVIPPDGGRGMRLAVSEADPDRVYLGMIAHHGTVFESRDGGTTFQQVYQDTVHQSLTTYTGLVGGDSNGQYNFSMTCDPLNADILYWGTQTLWKSTDAGRSWTSLYGYAVRVHPDIHDLKFSPFDHSLFNVNDGGIAVSPDDGQSWFQRNDGIVAAEIYHGGQSPIQHDMVYIGTQDNGGITYADGRWEPRIRGDVYDQFWFDYHTPDRVYSNQGYSVGLQSRKNYPLNFPVADKGTQRFAFTPADTSLVFLCQNEVWRCRNINSSSPVWTRISEPVSGSGSAYIRDMAVSPLNANELYVVLPNDRILHTQNALAEQPVFDTLTAPWPSSYFQTCIALSGRQPDRLFYASWNKVFQSLDLGHQWMEITGSLPDDNIIKILQDEHGPAGSLYALCANRVFYRNDSIGDWVLFDHGLPSLAYISDLQMYHDGSRKSVLRAITYGRGVFETPLYLEHHLPWCDFTADTNVVCTAQPVTFTYQSLDATSWRWTFEGGTPSQYEGETPPIVIYKEPGTYSVTLEVANPYGIHTRMKKEFIKVIHHTPLPIFENFEGTFPPPHVELAALDSSNITWTHASLGAFGQSAYCAVFNDSYNPAKARMRLNAQLTNVVNASLRFDVAYARRIGNTEFDTLDVLISNDCGASYATVYSMGGNSLSTMPDIETPLAFNPGPQHWRSEQVDLSPFCGDENVFIVLQARGSHGEIIAVDNIQIESIMTSTSSIHEQVNAFSLHPNPAHDIVTWTGHVQQNGRIVITSGSGATVWESVSNRMDQPVQWSVESWPPGHYIVTWMTPQGSYSRVLTVQ